VGLLKKIGFLSFGHWSDSYGSRVRSAADTLLLTVPNTLGVDYNAHIIESILTYVAPELGWR
jgi:hypothetical protein